MNRKYLPKNFKPMPDTAKKVFSGIIFDVYQWPQEMYDGSIETFERLKRPDTVQVIGVLDDGNIILTHEEQPQKEAFYGFPGGRCEESDENEFAAAKREMLEETGYSFKNWRLIAAKVEYNKIDWIIYTFLATEVESVVEPKLDAGEKITIKPTDFNKVKEIATPDSRRRLAAIRPYDTLEALLNASSLANYEK